MEVKTKKGKSVMFCSEPVKVNFVQTSERTAKKEELKVQEKYALVLFDFNKDTISPLNQEIIKRLADRMQKLPDATAQITGHTDNVGKEAYNIDLSIRRAAAVYKKLAEDSGSEAGKRIGYSGVGPKSPLYANTTPEGRAFNRTVTVTLNYMSAE
jgi:outer membrane protein OmpA-like peptidoglycan-associated protein